MEDEAILVMLIQQYSAKYGITFSSSLLNDPENKNKLIKLIQECMAGKRGPVTDEDFT